MQHLHSYLKRAAGTTSPVTTTTSPPATTVPVTTSPPATTVPVITSPPATTTAAFTLTSQIVRLVLSVLHCVGGYYSTLSASVDDVDCDSLLAAAHHQKACSAYLWHGSRTVGIAGPLQLEFVPQAQQPVIHGTFCTLCSMEHRVRKVLMLYEACNRPVP